MRKAHKQQDTTKHELAEGPAEALVNWYMGARRHLPWREDPGRVNDPYHVWLSEVMLQQTTVSTVISYYEKFLRLWPRVVDLAAANQESVLREWAGLGYYARARNLHKCAQVVARDYGGVFPNTADELVTLPGIGPYTARAVAALAYGERVVPVDGNIERVVTRLYQIARPVVAAKDEIKARAQALLDVAPSVFPADLAQGLMDLGAGVCTPRSPKCPLCPLRDFCAAHRAGDMERYPVPAPKKIKPTRVGQVFVVRNKKGEVMLVRRPQTGLLAGMLGFPGTEWGEGSALPIEGEILGQVRHSFTHFNLILDVVHMKPRRRPGSGKKDDSGRAADFNILPGPGLRRDYGGGLWCPHENLSNIGLPKVFLKVVPFIPP